MTRGLQLFSISAVMKHQFSSFLHGPLWTSASDMFNPGLQFNSREIWALSRTSLPQCGAGVIGHYLNEMVQNRSLKLLDSVNSFLVSWLKSNPMCHRSLSEQTDGDSVLQNTIWSSSLAAPIQSSYVVFNGCTLKQTPTQIDFQIIRILVLQEAVPNHSYSTSILLLFL